MYVCAFVCSLIFLHWESRVKNLIIEIYVWLKILKIYTICSGAATSKIYFTKIIIQIWIFTFSSMEAFSYWTKNEKKVCLFDSVFNPLFLQISKLKSLKIKVYGSKGGVKISIQMSGPLRQQWLSPVHLLSF